MVTKDLTYPYSSRILCFFSLSGLVPINLLIASDHRRGGADGKTEGRKSEGGRGLVEMQVQADEGGPAVNPMYTCAGESFCDLVGRLEPCLVEAEQQTAPVLICSHTTVLQVCLDTWY